LVASSLRSPAPFVPCAAASTSVSVVPPAPPVTRAETRAGTCSATQSKNVESFEPPSFLPSFVGAGAGAPPSRAASASCACFAAPRAEPARPVPQGQARDRDREADGLEAREVEVEVEPARTADLPVVRALDGPEELAQRALCTRGSSGVSALNWPERKNVVRLPYAGELTIESRNDVSDAGSEASEDPSDAAPALPAAAAAAASCGIEACSAASAAASADFLSRGYAFEPDVLLRVHEHAREYASDALTAQQSMNGLP
jgi:hypothetical protein